jgi:hypothetical protein
LRLYDDTIRYFRERIVRVFPAELYKYCCHPSRVA